MSWPIEEYPITKLFLDQENIRTPISDKDQSALIQDMFSNEDAFSIAKSYAQNGVFPDEFPIAVLENNKTVIIEGNRRLSALKAIFEPDIVPKWSKKIKDLGANKITKIRIVLAPNRQDAVKHIANKHTNNYKRSWKPLRQAYFYKSQIDNGKTVEELIKEFPDHDVVRFIKMLEMHHLAKSLDLDETISQKVHDERRFPITNLERFVIDDKTVSAFLGIKFDNAGRIKGEVPKEEFKKGYKKIIEDIGTGYIDSRKFNTSKERKKYIEGFPKEFTPDKTKKGSFKSRDFKEVPKKKLPAKPKERSKKIPKGLFFQSDVPFNASSSSLHFMYIELKNIDVKNFPNATHDLLRSFLECSLVHFLKENGEFKSIQKNPKHNPRLSEILTFVSSDACSVVDESVKQLIRQVKGDWSEGYSLERMNMINHHTSWSASEKDVRIAWAKLEPLFKIILRK